MADLLEGYDSEGWEWFCDDVYNNLKNHWRMSDPCGELDGLTAGMIVSDSDDDKLYHVITGETCGEIIQGAVDSLTLDDIIHYYGTDSNILLYYDEVGNDEFMIEAANRADTEGVSISLLEINQRFRLRQNSDVITEWHDGTDANIAWTGTDLNLLPPAGGAVTIDGGANNLAAGLNIINLGTATKGVDLSNSGLGAGDHWFYGSVSNYWRADGTARIDTYIVTRQMQGTANFPFIIKAVGAVNIIFYMDSNSSELFGNPTEVGSFTACTVGAASAIIQHADIDTNTAVGDFLHVTSGTGVTLGFYRIIAVGVNQVTVDRDVSGAGDTDIACIVYKDVIGFFATDGVNGQRIMNYSHQDKPLQIGGDTLQATVGMGSEDVVLGGITGYTRQGALYNWTYQGDLADDATFNLPAFTDACWGFIQAGNNEEYALFTVDNVGNVTLISNSANVVANADTNTKLCLGIASPEEPLTIRNRLGATKNINLIIWYS